MFVAVVDLGSFSKAAVRLGTSSGQASKLVGKLESDLGVQLLRRTTRALSPTEIGQAYYERIKSLLLEFDSLDASVRSASGTMTGRIRLTVPVTFGERQLAPILSSFASSYSDVELDVSFSDRIVSIVDEGFDVAIRIGNPQDSNLIARKLCDVKIMVVASSDYLARRGTPRHPKELSAHECIIDTNFRNPSIWTFNRTGKGGLNVEVSGRLHFSNAEAALVAASVGLGIARTPSFIAASRIQAGEVVTLLRRFETHTLGVYAIYPPGRHLALKVRTFVDFLSEHYRAGAPWEDEG
jgi:DNA-binding transcriptional LysR family regulator